MTRRHGIEPRATGSRSTRATDASGTGATCRRGLEPSATDARITSELLATKLGYAKRQQLEDLAKRHAEFVNKFGRVLTVSIPCMAGARGMTTAEIPAYNRRQVLYLIGKSETPVANELHARFVDGRIAVSSRGAVRGLTGGVAGSRDIERYVSGMLRESSVPKLPLFHFITPRGTPRGVGDIDSVPGRQLSPGAGGDVAQGLARLSFVEQADGLPVMTMDGVVIRVAGTPERPLFCATDVCRALDIRDTSDACDKLAQDEVELVRVNTASGSKQATFTTESGLYKLVFKSRKPRAQEFGDWVTGEVLPSIRKTGSYSTEAAQSSGRGAHVCGLLPAKTGEELILAQPEGSAGASDVEVGDFRLGAIVGRNRVRNGPPVAVPSGAPVRALGRLLHFHVMLPQDADDVAKLGWHHTTERRSSNWASAMC